VVAASSNESENLPEWPAHLTPVIGVTAADCSQGTLLLRPGHPVLFAAAGVGITVPVPGGGYAQVTGSSFATARVSGLLGRLLSEFPGISPSMARESLEHFAQEEDVE
jgi:subtilisin family serine protease